MPASITPRYYWGLDPGYASGGICILDSDGDILYVDDLPFVVTKTSKKTKSGKTKRSVKRALDIELFMEIVSETLTPIDLKFSFCVLERAHARPKEGVTSSFKTGVGFGVMQSALFAAGIPFIIETPSKWKKKVFATKTLRALKDEHGMKEASRLYAIELWPHRKNEFRLKKDHNKAEAALLAYYGFLRHRD